MVVIGFFRDLTQNLGALVEFVTLPINDLYGDHVAVIGNWSILQAFSVSIGATLVFFLGFHLLRLIIGG